MVSRCFQGVVQVESQPITSSGEDEATSASAVAAEAESLSKPRLDGHMDDQGNPLFDPSLPLTKRETPFFLLAMDLPPPPPVLSGSDEDVLPQITISHILTKYDGHSSTPLAPLSRATPCVVSLPSSSSTSAVSPATASATNSAIPRSSIFPSRVWTSPSTHPRWRQDAGRGVRSGGECGVRRGAGTVRQDASWKCQVHTNDAAKEKWFAIQDLLVEEVNRQMIFLGESYLQIWQKRSA